MSRVQGSQVYFYWIQTTSWSRLYREPSAFFFFFNCCLTWRRVDGLISAVLPGVPLSVARWCLPCTLLKGELLRTGAGVSREGVYCFLGSLVTGASYQLRVGPTLHAVEQKP